MECYLDPLPHARLHTSSRNYRACCRPERRHGEGAGVGRVVGDLGPETQQLHVRVWRFRTTRPNCFSICSMKGSETQKNLDNYHRSKNREGQLPSLKTDSAETCLKQSHTHFGANHTSKAQEKG